MIESVTRIDREWLADAAANGKGTRRLEKIAAALGEV